MAIVKLQPIMKLLRMLLLMPTAYVRYTDISAMEQGERKVAIPRRNNPRNSSNISRQAPRSWLIFDDNVEAVIVLYESEM